MEKRLEDFVERLVALADIRNLDRFNPITFTIQNPNSGEATIIVVAFNEPHQYPLPLNVTWISADPTSALYKKALIRESKQGLGEYGLLHEWRLLDLYADIFDPPQYYLPEDDQNIIRDQDVIDHLNDDSTNPHNVTAEQINALSVLGGTMQGFLSLFADPVDPSHAVTKSYSDEEDQILLNRIDVNTFNIDQHATTLNDHQNTIDTLETTTNQHTTDIAAQGVRLTTAEGNIVQAQSDIVDLRSDTDTNTNNIAANSTAIGQNALSISSNTTNISQNASDIGVLRTDTDANTAATAQNATDISGLRTDTDANTGNIATNTTDIGNLRTDTDANTANVATNTSDIGDLRTDTDTNTGNIATNTSDISGLRTDTDANTANVATNTVDIADHNTRLLDLESKLNSLSHKHVQSVAASVWNVNHGNNSEDFTYNVFDAFNEPLIPDNVVTVDPNNVQFVFSTPIDGKALMTFLIL